MTARIARGAMVLLLACGGAAVASAQAAGPSTLEASAAPSYLGAWDVVLRAQGASIPASLAFLDEEGRLVAVVGSHQGNQRVTDIARTDEGLRLRVESPVGVLTMIAIVDGDVLRGSLHADGGFDAALEGKRSADTELLARLSAAAAPSGATRGSFFGTVAPQTRLDVEGGRIAVRYPDTKQFPSERRALAGGGELVRFPEGSAIKLRTDVPLAFGELTVGPGNVADGYPGVYSLWLERGDSGWRLLFNDEADVWGTQHDPAHDVGAVALQAESLSAPAPALEVVLERTAEGATLRFRLEDRQLTTSFRLAAPSGSAAPR